ncbi:MAG: TIR domain-containing protein [Anaerolineae bacterium]
MTDDLHEHLDTDEHGETEPIEAYCVRCRETVWLDDPIPVWTRKGAPATRGDCPSCGSPVFRLGGTPAHDKKHRPAPVQVGGESKRMKLPKTAVYLNYAPADEAIAVQVAADLEKMGFALWLHQTSTEDVEWAGGVHPSLKECSRMVMLLSPAALQEETVEMAWKFFREKNKPIIVATVAHADPPDLLRRKPRFDLLSDYKSAFRQMLSALNE